MLFYTKIRSATWNVGSKLPLIIISTHIIQKTHLNSLKRNLKLILKLEYLLTHKIISSLFNIAENLFNSIIMSFILCLFLNIIYIALVPLKLNMLYTHTNMYSCFSAPESAYMRPAICLDQMRLKIFSFIFIL